MDRTTIIGLILGLIAVGFGMVLKGVNLVALLNPAALLIIFVGTAASVCIAFPTSTIKNVPSLFKIIFKEETHTDMKEIIDLFTELANLTRKEGLLSLEKKINMVDDIFLKSGLQLIIDAKSTEFIKEVMIEKIDAMEERHQKGISVFSQAGTYAPTLGVLGAVIGLIASLSNLNDIEQLGHAISAAFIATLFGIFTGYVLWHPFANKLREKSQNEMQIKQIITEGVLSIANGESPHALRDKLCSYLSAKELAKMKRKDVGNATEE